MWIEGFINALSLTNILWLLLGTVVGLVIGVLPALGANFGVALMLPFTFGMDPAAAIIFLCAIHASCNYGDSVTSILLNVPGGPGTVASCWDGYPLSQQGRGGEAIGIATFSSFIGGFSVWLMLALTVGPITKIALAFGAPEYFTLMLMALGLISVASKGETVKGLIMVCFGLALSAVGQDEVLGTTYRFSYGIPWVEAGIPVVVSTLGLFAISQVIVLLEEGGTVSKRAEVKDSILKGFGTTIRRPLTLLRGMFVGAFIGVLPALGVSLAGIASYLTEKKYSREASQFGKGAPSGLIAAEVGKGACVVGDLIPTFTLGIPGSVTGAILLAALIMLGITPGPKFLLSGPLPYTIFAGLLLAQATFLISGLVFGKWMCRVAYIQNTILAPILTVLIFLGAYSERNYSVDMIIALAFGLFAYILGKLGYQMVCLVLGLILGPIVEVNFHRSLAMSYGSYSVFFTRPISVIMLSITGLFLILPTLLDLIRRYRHKSLGVIEEAIESESSGNANLGYKSELILLFFVALILVIFLVTARGYKPLVRLFPDLVSLAGLGFIVWRLIAIIYHAAHRSNDDIVPPAPWPSLSLFRGSLSWPCSIATMLAYVLLIYAFGFIIASGLYMAVSLIITMGYNKWKLSIVSGVLVGIGVFLFAKVVHLLFPVGILMGK